MLNLPALCHPKLFPHEKYELNSYVQNYDAPTVNGKGMYWFWGTSTLGTPDTELSFKPDQYFPNPTPDPRASPLLAESHAKLPKTREKSTQSAET